MDEHPSPFWQCDSDRENVEWLMTEVKRLKVEHELLMSIVKMLGEAEAFRIEKVRKK